MKSVQRFVRNKKGLHILPTRHLVTTLEERMTSPARPWSEIPQPPRIPLLGSIQFMTNKSIEALEKIHLDLKHQYGEVYKITVLGDTYVHIHNPGDVETLLRNDGTMPILPGFDGFAALRKADLKKYFPETARLLSHNDEWLQFRKAVQQDMMRPKTAMHYIRDIEDIAMEFNEVLESNLDTDRKADIGNLTQQFALEAIGAIFVGKKFGVLQGSEEGKILIDKANVIMKHSMALVFIPHKFVKRMKLYKEVVSAWFSILDLLSTNVKKVIDKIDIKNESDDAVLSRLVRKHGKTSQIPLVMAVDALFAGIDTTGHTASFLLYHLARNPEKQELLYQEIVKFMGEEGELTAQSLSKMKYLKACQIESQRILPVVSATARLTQVDMILGGYKIPAGTKVMRHIQVMQNCEKQFPQPQQFIPERWIRGDSASNTAHPYSNIPFGHGPRSCVGQRFAKLELTILLAKVVQRYKMEYRGEEVDVKTGFVGCPDKDIVITFTER